MAGLLEGGLAKSIYAGFKGKLLGGVIRRAAVPLAPGPLDAHGDPAPAVPIDTKIEGFTEAYSAFTRANAGIPATDLQLNIFAASCPGVEPQVGNLARLDRNGVGQWYQIRGPVAIDPAGVLWVCQSFEVSPPKEPAP